MTQLSAHELDILCNAITDYGMHAIKNIINSSRLTSLNLASNMISGEGLELFLDDLINNTSLKQLDLGVVESSMRKNSLGIQGAVCIAALLIRNQTIQSLAINDNDFGTDPEARRLYLKHGAKYLSSLNFQTVTFFHSLLQKIGCYFFRHKHYSFLRGIHYLRPNLTNDLR
mgnify:CR=1 FL=1